MTLAQCPAQQVVFTSQVKDLAHTLKSGTSTGGQETPKYSADDLKGLKLLVDGKAWNGSDLYDPSTLTWTGLPDGWMVADSTADGIRTLAFTAPDGTVCRTVRVGTSHDADRPKTDTADGTAKAAADASDGSRPLASTGVGVEGVLVLSAAFMLAAGIGLAFVSRRRE